jgi:hypothetical protein
MTIIKTVIRQRRVNVPAPDELPDGTEVLLTIEANADIGPVTPAEINRVLAAMQQLQPLDIPIGVAEDLAAWERQLDRHGIENAEKGIEDVFS